MLNRFISEDPLGLQGGINLYTYAANNPTNWIDPFGLDVTITRWRCCGGFDHIGIGVGQGEQPTVGFYPMTHHQPFDAGIVARDLDRQSRTDLVGAPLVIKTTPQQDKLIQAAIDARRNNPGRYNILSGRHCGGFVQEVLRAAEIDPISDVASPGAVFETLKALQEAGVDLTRGVPRIPR